MHTAQTPLGCRVCAGAGIIGQEPEPSINFISKPDQEPPEPAQIARSRSQSRQGILLGTGAGAEMLTYPEPEPE